MFLRSTALEQSEFRLEKSNWDLETYRKSQKKTSIGESQFLLIFFIPQTRLQYFALAIQGYIRKLDEFIKNKTKVELQKEENQVRVVAHRSAKNISTIIKDLFKIPPSYKSRIVVSWRPLSDKVCSFYISQLALCCDEMLKL